MMLLMHDHEGRDAKLTAIVQVKRPIRSGRPLALELGVLLVHVPADVAEDLVVIFFAEGVDTSNLLNLPWLEYTDENL